MHRRRWLRYIGLLLGAALLAGGVYVWRTMLHVETVRLDEHTWALLGGGGNTLVLDSSDGPLVVDTKMFTPARTLQKEVASLCGKPVHMVVNTHWHFDHTGGNARYVGAEFVGHSKTRAYLLEREPRTFGPGGAGERAVPTTLVDDRKQFQYGDDFVEVRYLGRGHTDGDVVVFLHKRSLLHAGDLFFNGYYPVFDPSAGGTLREWIGTLEKVMAIGAARIIPGHGPIATPADLARAHDYLQALWAAALDGARAGKSCEDLGARFDAQSYHLEPIPTFSSLSKNLEAACTEARAYVASGAAR